MREKKRLIGPFSQILTMELLPSRGPLNDHQLVIIEKGAVLMTGQKIDRVVQNKEFIELSKKPSEIDWYPITSKSVLIPGLIDSHTHICYAGGRADDYARRLAGESYLEIAKKGGGILSTVANTREASAETLTSMLHKRAKTHLARGITTCEVKSGYGLNLDSELKMLRVIKDSACHDTLPDLISTCLAAHVKPVEFQSHREYLDFVVRKILPVVKKEHLSTRVDIFVEEEAFDINLSIGFLQKARSSGFTVTVHADQFSSGGSLVASKTDAISADHLEASQQSDLEQLKKGNVIATVLPGASLGLGVEFAPARKILNTGLSLVIASDWNPGSAPMGDLLMQASVLGAAQKLTLAETLAAITVRAAGALDLNDRGSIQRGNYADMIAFPTDNYREIFYHQGALKPDMIWKHGNLIKT
ncbi:MAG: imidazolonepropionase [Proteobacteria bacterium]|nr:imidazolonepropionase [Pseudomonadota bacterium]